MVGESYDFKVNVIGAGCICSNLIPFLVRMGIRDLTVFDPDTIEEHNLKNQFYRRKDIGRPKVEALAEIIYDLTGVAISTERRRVEKEYFDSVVICGVDSMSSRRKVWEASIKLQPQIRLYIEARVGGPVLKVYSIDPTDLASITLYEENLHNDSPTQPDCAQGEIPTLAATCSVITRLIRDFTRGISLPNETIADVATWTVLSQ